MKQKHWAVLTAASLALSGCNSPLLARLGLAPKRLPPVEQALASAEPRVDAALFLDEGRAQLRAGQISAAVASFRMARMDPAFAAEAENGLGVAYAKLGRADIAGEYFRAAIARAPGEMRFAANYLRLQREVELVRASAAATPVRTAATDRDMAPRRADAAPVHRLSDGAVHIVTAPPAAAAPRMAIAFREKPRLPGDTEAAARSAPAPAPAAPSAAAEPAEKVIVLQP